MQMTDSIRAKFRQLGLSKLKIDIYVCLLERGVCTVSELAHKTGRPRSTLRASLNSLIKSNLIEQADKKYGKKYKLAPLRHLFFFISNVNTLEKTRLLWKRQRSKLVQLPDTSVVIESVCNSLEGNELYADADSQSVLLSSRTTGRVVHRITNSEITSVVQSLKDYQ